MFFHSFASVLARTVLIWLALGSARLSAGDSPGGRRPVLWYCLHFQAPGENRYTPEGAYKDILQILGKSFDVRVDAERPSSRNLRGVDVVLISNPNAAAVGTNPPPAKFSSSDIRAFRKFVRGGGGLIVMGNQENHNLEVESLNRLLKEFGLALTNDYTDFKTVTFPDGVPAVGGMRWAFYSGNRVEVLPNPSRGIRARGWYQNRSSDKPEKGDRSADGFLMAASEVGKGRVIVVTDSGWIGNNSMNGVGINGFYLQGHQNAEIMTRMTRWAAGR